MRAITVISLIVAGVLILGSSTFTKEDDEKIVFVNSGKVLPAGLPFSDAVRVGNTLYVSGLIGIEPKTMKLVPGGLKPEAVQTLEHIKTVLESSGYTMDDIVKVNVFLADMSEWAAFNEVYKTYFKHHFPARSAFGANGLALGARVEIECIAAKVE